MIHRLRGLSRKSIAEIILAISSLPSSVTTLDFHNNYLFKRSGAELGRIFAATPISVTTLNLSTNYFGNISGTELALAFATIPEWVTTVELFDNELGIIIADELALAFAAIPKWVTILDLSDDKIHKLNMKDMAKLSGSLPYVKTIYLSYEEVSGMDDEKRKALKDIFPNLSNTIFLDKYSDTLGAPGMKRPPIVTKKPVQCANLARRLGFPAAVPSLQSQVAFFVKENKLDITKLPEQVQNIVKKY